PLLGVSVMEENTTNGTVTGMDGEFSLRLNSDANNLVFSYTGMKTQIIPINGRSNFQISMEEDQLALEEVVVVGYGTTRKINLTGAVSTVKAEKLVEVPSPNLSDALVGKSPGLFAFQSQGVPGADYANLSIRGFDAPLVLVGGIETSWTRIDPNTIESVSVLNDAAAAIYGARAG